RCTPSLLGYQLESTRAAIDGEALQQFNECFHFSCTARNASAYPAGTGSLTAANAVTRSSRVCVTSVSSGPSSTMETTRLSTPAQQISHGSLALFSLIPAFDLQR